MSVNEAIETQLYVLEHVKEIKQKDNTMIYEEIVHRSLEYGSTYYWSQDFVRLLEGQANMLPEDAVLNMTDFLSEAGFLWFEKPVTMPNDPSVQPRFEKWEKSWHEALTHIESDTQEASDTAKTLSLSLDEYHTPDGRIDVEKIKAFRARGAKGTLRLKDSVTGRISERVLPLEKLNVLIETGNNKLEDVRIALEKWERELQVFHSEMETKPLRAISWVMVNEGNLPIVYFVWWTEDRVLNPRTGIFPEFVFPWYLNRNLQYMSNLAEESKYDDDATRITQALKYACASVLFMVQKVFSHSDERPNRAVRHRISTWRPDPIVKVIRLRRAQQHANSNPEHDSPEHAFQWMVTGHWRNQWYSASNTHRTIWIAPFIKGPPDKPLKEPRARIYAVVR